MESRACGRLFAVVVEDPLELPVPFGDRLVRMTARTTLGDDVVVVVAIVADAAVVAVVVVVVVVVAVVAVDVVVVVIVVVVSIVVVVVSIVLIIVSSFDNRSMACHASCGQERQETQ